MRSVAEIDREKTMKKFIAAFFALAGLAAFAGTCVVTRMSFVPIDGSHATFAGQVDNTSGVNILQHNVTVAFLDSNNNVVETQTVAGCLRSLQNGTSDFFSATSNYAASSTSSGLARIAYDGTFQVGTTTATNISITNVSAVRNTTTLSVTGTTTNNSGATLISPNACLVVRTSAGNVLTTGVASMPNINSGSSQVFTGTIGVPNDSSAYTVDVWVDALDASSNPTTPQSSTGTIVANGPNKLAWSTQPENTTAGTVFVSQPVVQLQDSNGNILTSAADAVTLSVVSGSGTLACTTNPLAASYGIATFSGCNLSTAGTYILRATASGYTSADTGSIVISPGAAAKLGFSTQPSIAASSGVPLAQQPIVQVQDAGGNAIAQPGIAITLASNPGSSGLACTTNPVSTDANGTATFAGCTLSVAGSYTLTASGTYTPAVSNSVTVSAAAAAKLAFTAQPSAAATSGTPLAQQPVVQLQDAAGNSVAQAGIAITLASTPGGSGLACTTSPVSTDANGTGTFAGCTFSVAGSYTLTASGTYTPAVSNSVTVSAGAATKLAFTTQPSATATAATVFAQQPVVTVEDAAGNVVTTDNATSITLTIAGTGPGTLTCTTNPVVVTGGVATFAGCEVSVAGTNHLVATATPALTTPSSANIVTT